MGLRHPSNRTVWWCVVRFPQSPITPANQGLRFKAALMSPGKHGNGEGRDPELLFLGPSPYGIPDTWTLPRRRARASDLQPKRGDGRGHVRPLHPQMRMWAGSRALAPHPACHPHAVCLRGPGPGAAQSQGGQQAGGRGQCRAPARDGAANISAAPRAWLLPMECSGMSITLHLQSPATSRDPAPTLLL